MNKTRFTFTIPDEEVPGFTQACKNVTGENPFWRHKLIDSDGIVYQICDLSLAKYELLILRLSVNGGRFLDLEAQARAEAEEAKRQQSQSDTTQPQMA